VDVDQVAGTADDNKN
jgi:hypothetical protein